MEMCQCVRKTSSEGVCELSPSASARLGLPISGDHGYTCDVDGINCMCDRQNKFSSSKSSGLNCEHGLRVRSSCTSTSSSGSERRKLQEPQTCSCPKGFSSTPPRRFKNLSSIFGLNLTNSFVLSRSFLLLLLVLLRNVLVEGAPPHTSRHHHHKPEKLPLCSSQRVPRDVHSMSLKESETAGLCPSEACLDYDVRRRPVHITRVRCLSPDNNATSCSNLLGDYQCTQLWAQVEVWQEELKPYDGSSLTELWTADNRTQTMVRTNLKIEHGCVCASRKAKLGLNPTFTDKVQS